MLIIGESALNKLGSRPMSLRMTREFFCVSEDSGELGVEQILVARDVVGDQR
jgi:hypothetical protein